MMTPWSYVPENWPRARIEHVQRVLHNFGNKGIWIILPGLDNGLVQRLEFDQLDSHQLHALSSMYPSSNCLIVMDVGEFGRSLYASYGIEQGPFIPLDPVVTLPVMSKVPTVPNTSTSLAMPVPVEDSGDTNTPLTKRRSSSSPVSAPSPPQPERVRHHLMKDAPQSAASSQEAMLLAKGAMSASVIASLMLRDDDDDDEEEEGPRRGSLDDDRHCRGKPDTLLEQLYRVASRI
jgi:hypothetical protein